MIGYLLRAALLALTICRNDAFLFPSSRRVSLRRSNSWLSLKPEYFAPDEDTSGRNGTVVTKEMFMREMLQDPVVKRKGKNRQYKPLDNRDSLPYQVEIPTPDPYTHPEQKRKLASKNRVKKKPNAIEHGISSSLYSADGTDSDETNTKTLLGEFVLDKHTTTGDLLQIGDKQYKVVRHKCQYKYAGGQRFVMVRKILQVKEVGRLQTEEYLKRQWKQSKD